MTEEVTEAMIHRAWADFVNAKDDIYFGNASKMEKQIEVLRRLVQTAMRSASNSPTNYGIVPSKAQYETPSGDFNPNSPTTNGEVTEPRQTHCADPDCTGSKPHVAEAAGCKWGNPRAASDDEVAAIVKSWLGNHAISLRPAAWRELRDALSHKDMSK